MNPPTQPVDRRRPLRDKDFPAIHQQLELPRHLIMGGDRQVGFSQKSRATASASIGSDLPRVRAEARAWAINFGGTRTTCWPAVIRSRSSRADRCRQSSIAHTTSAPNRSRAHITASACPTGRRDDLLPELASHLVDGDKRMGALVHIGSNNNHGGCLLHCEVTVGPVGGHISVGAVPRSYQVTPAGPSHLMPTKRMDANPKAATSYEPDIR